MTTVQATPRTKHLDHFIGGEYCASASGETFTTSNPATGQVLATVALGNATDVDRAVSAARQAFDRGPWPRMTVSERAAILKKIGDLILERREQLAIAETMDTGKPITESFEGDIPRAALNFHFFADFAAVASEQSYPVSGQERHFAVREPLGVAALITPWNLPLYLATWKIAPCLAAGNTCVVKPAEWSPYTATLLCQIASQAGLPPGVLNIVHGMGAAGAGEALTRHPDINCISFTGETSTGRAIASAAAAGLKKLSFELGGKGANIIFDDADLSEAIPAAVRAAFRNQGEICLAGSRLFVHESIFERVVDQLVAATKNLIVGDPLEKSTQMGAIISAEQLAKVESYIALGKEEGKLLCGGERVSSLPAGNFLTPAILTGISNRSRFCQEEIFGPVLPIIPFSSDEEAIALANDTPYGLSASLWSRDVNRCHNVSRQLKTGIVWVNCWFARDLRTPFGGQKQSGLGREGGQYSLDFFSDLKTICYRYKG
jgi:aminomuconate-semialdehyde/2-hydroxymuconate-6-semialdehyde dehydrogenase